MNDYEKIIKNLYESEGVESLLERLRAEDVLESTLTDEAAYAIETLMRERDEALAREKDALRACELLEFNYSRGREHNLAEARAKALEEAAKVVTDAAAIVDHPSVYMGGPTRHAKWVAQQFADVILALKDKP